MASRERPASGRVTETARRPPKGPPAPRTDPPPAPAGEVPASWEDVYRAAPPDLKRELMALARSQGFLYAHQLPRGRNGTPAEGQAVPAALRDLLNGQVQGLEPVRPAPVAPRDAALDPAQREAVARALATPDVCLVRGLPGTGKTRVVAEIVAQAAARGERVLLLAQSAAAVDGVLERLGTAEDICAVRCLGPDERPEDLPPASRAATFAERLRQLGTAARQAAGQALAEREETCRRLRQAEAAWASLQALTDRLGQVQEQRAALAGRREQAAADVGREAAAVEAGPAPANPFQAALLDALRRGREAEADADQALATVRGKAEENRQLQESLQTRLDALRPLAEARRGGRWWTRMWWQASKQKTLLADFEALDSQLDQARGVGAELQADAARLTRARDEAADALRDRLRELQDAEAGRRRAEADHQVAGLDRDIALLREQWQAAVRALDADGPRPADPSAEAVREGRAAWREQIEQAERRRDLSRRWVGWLDEATPWADMLAATANPVAATLTALPADAHFGDRAARGCGFDLLVMQEADQLTEADFLRVAGRARRWVLVGEPSFDPAAPPGRSYALRPARPATLRAGLFEKLWQHLHGEPHGLPYAWAREDQRLVCRLRPVPADARQHLEVEGVSDFPDIELRILALPGAQPVLAEVVFPPAVSVAEAKAYIFKELDELAVQTGGRGACWVEEPHRLVYLLDEEVVPEAEAVVLGPGVRERVGAARPGRNGSGGGPWLTHGLEFDRAAGWDRARAEAWVERHLGVRDLGRTARLDVPHRMHPDLAAVVSHLLFQGEYRAAAAGGPARTEFVPVPPARERGAGPSRKGGAGLEVDLTDPRHRSRLPADLGVELPAHGFVNYAEAQAVVRALEALADDPAGLLHTEAPARPLVAVTAPYAAQVELLRGLVRRSGRLAGATFDVAVDPPAAFREREAAAVFLSLTRSHAHRPVTYGDGPEVLALALTRARERLVLFGDPGSLARRSQWEGPLEHLDGRAAARECELVTRLVEYLDGRGRYPGAFRLCEGVGP